MCCITMPCCVYLSLNMQMALCYCCWLKPSFATEWPIKLDKKQINERDIVQKLANSISLLSTFAFIITTALLACTLLIFKVKRILDFIISVEGNMLVIKHVSP